MVSDGFSFVLVGFSRSGFFSIKLCTLAKQLVGHCCSFVLISSTVLSYCVESLLAAV